jgi:hypothetical protein
LTLHQHCMALVTCYSGSHPTMALRKSVAKRLFEDIKPASVMPKVWTRLSSLGLNMLGSCSKSHFYTRYLSDLSYAFMPNEP